MVQNTIGTNKNLENYSVEDRIKWALDVFELEDIAFTSAFGTYAAAYIHVVNQVIPNLEVYFLDTRFHFKETWNFKAELEERLDIKVKVVEPLISVESLKSTLGEKPYEISATNCCNVNKVAPLNSVLENKDLWITGVQKHQTNNRKNVTVLEQRNDLLYKLNPILNWTTKDIYDYTVKHDLPLHPLFENGYSSIGCSPCTRAVQVGEDERAGRWSGQNKTECGLHL